ncbi:MAG TPA: flagellar protein FlgN [Smithellaceae bacterium]|nr:flagellar protein FlgN [Smithellaceae bacterium]
MLEENISLAETREENSCENSFDILIDVLRKELEIYRELKEHILREKNVLMKPSLDDLYDSNARKENIILKARMLEDARTKTLKKILINLDIKEVVTLSEIAKYAVSEQKREITEIRNELALISQQIKTLNEVNKDLINVSITNVKGSLEFIDSMISRATVYMETGQVKTIQNKGKYLRTEG